MVPSDCARYLTAPDPNIEEDRASVLLQVLAGAKARFYEVSQVNHRDAFSGVPCGNSYVEGF